MKEWNSVSLMTQFLQSNGNGLYLKVRVVSIFYKFLTDCTNTYTFLPVFYPVNEESIALKK